MRPQARRERGDSAGRSVGGVGEEIAHSGSMLPRRGHVSLRDEATELLQELLRLDTVNPPGNETLAAELLRGYLEDAGLECELYARVPERANLVARIPGRGEGPSLLLLSHTDTVLADPGEWSVDPWSGELRDGGVWGRGALDMKSHVAAAAVAIATLAREGFEPAGDLVFVATADEEVGEDSASRGSAARIRTPCVRTTASTRAAATACVVDGRPVYLCSTAEKMSSPFLLRVHGRSGHASMPGIADNALVRAARLIERLGEVKRAPRLLPETEALFSELWEAPPTRPSWSRPSQPPPGSAPWSSRCSAWRSRRRSSRLRRANVIPGLCEVVCDCRLLPGETPAEAEPLIRAALGEDGYELEWVEGIGGTRSPLGTPLWDGGRDLLRRGGARARLVPSSRPASRTATSCARPSGRSPTASSPCGR